jgi:hypothetical protein
MIQNLINHVVFVVDQSGSMGHLTSETVRVFDNQVKYLAQRSQELNQETRVSVYVFNREVRCLVYDMDVMRLPSLKGHYSPNGSTALIKGVTTAIDELGQTATIHGDHAFLIYTLTDGQETENRYGGPALASKIKSLPENWTLAVLVPNSQSVFEAKNYGFPAQNIAVWETTSEGAKEVDNVITRSVNNFMVGRSTGSRGTKNLFQIDTANLTPRVLSNKLDELSGGEYLLLNVRRDEVIKPFVESWTTKSYVPGSSYYQLVKKEKIQPYKQVCIQNRRNGKVYSGSKARQMLGLGNSEVTATPGSYGDFDVYVQSTSVNRKLPAGTKLIVLN